MRLIDADKLKRRAQRVATEAWKMKTTASVETILNQFIDWIDEAQTVDAQDWIPVTERLPEEDTIVLAYGNRGGIYTAIYNNSKAMCRGWWKLNSKNHWCNPVAWMPLPKPWKGDVK